MQVAHLDELAFHLIGRRAGESLGAVAGRSLLPVALAPYRDIAALRHDFPLLLAPGRPAQSLAAAVDAASAGADDRFAGQARHLEKALRRLAAEHGEISLDEAFPLAATQADDAAGDAEGMADSLARLRAALPASAVLADCTRGLAGRLLAHEWEEARHVRAGRLAALIGSLARRLDDILKADYAASTEALTAERLCASVGAAQQDDFDFDTMARLLARVPRKGGLGERRKQRISGLLDVLRRQRFVAIPGSAAEPYGFVFDSAAVALDAWQTRRPEALALARALAMARLEANGDYDEARHDALFAAGSASAPLNAPGMQAVLRDFPDYLVLLEGTELAAQAPVVLQAFGAGLPFKVLARHDDLLEATAPAPTFAVDPLAMTALSLGEVFVMQAGASQLAALGPDLRAGLAGRGPALYTVFSGAGPETGGLSPYLVSAAAVESRAFPSFVYDPQAGTAWAERFRLAGNPQPEAPWAEHTLEWQDAAFRRQSVQQAFTAVEFLALDTRLASELAEIAPQAWNEAQVSPAEMLAAPAAEGRVPALPMADVEGQMHRVVAGEALLAAARGCQARWKLLQALGGAGAARPAAEVAVAAPEPAPEPKPAPAAAEAPAAEARDPDVSWLDTPRCSSCGECLHINAKMFVYDANGQATLADPAAGSFRQMVEAAEGCPVAAIHPGKPLDAKESGLEDLLKRAEALR